jgi:acetylornithine deacetylase/succinyl-diaminopimelate desuccinylase-like protein
VRQALVTALADSKIDVALDEKEIAGPKATVDADLMRTVEKVSAQLFPGVPVVPTMSAGATDSKYFRLAGVPAYGVSGIFIDIDDVRAHGRDERVGVKQFFEGQEFLTRLVSELVASTP